MMHSYLLFARQWAVPADAGYDFYTLCYVLAFAVNLLLLVWEGRRRGYPMRSWLVVLACTSLAFILGTKLLALSGPELQQLLSTGHWPHLGARTVLGGSLAASLTLLALRRPFGFSWHVFDAYSLPLCAALVVQCVGCLLTGCCFGEVTAGGWGLTYSAGTLPYVVQASQGLIPDGAAHSLPVHPTQLYTLLLCGAVGAALLLTRKRSWPAGSRHFLHLGLLLAGRFAIEFWREPVGEPLWATSYSAGGFTMLQLQWVILPLIPLLLGAWLWLVRQARLTAYAEGQPTQNAGRNLLVVAALLGLTAWLGASALTLPEVLVVKALLLAVLVLEGGALLLGAAEATQPARAALPLGLATVVLVLTSQAPATSDQADSARTGEAAYFSFTPGVVSGRYDEDKTYVPSGGCSGTGGVPVRTGFYHAYQAVGGDFAYTRPSHRPGRTTYGIGLWTGHEYVNAMSLDPNGPFLTANPRDGKRYSLFDFNPYVERARLHDGGFGYGLRVGLHVGELAHLGPSSLDPSLRKVSFQPDVKIWLGVRRVVFGQVEAGTGPLALGNFTSRFALGSGLGSDWNRLVLVGVAQSRHQSGATMGFLSASFPLGHSGLWLEPYGATNFGRHRQATLQLQYRLGQH